MADPASSEFRIGIPVSSTSRAFIDMSDSNFSTDPAEFDGLVAPVADATISIVSEELDCLSLCNQDPKCVAAQV